MSLYTHNVFQGNAGTSAKFLDLEDVTLVSIDTVCHDLTRMAIAECTDRVDFGDVKIFSDRDGPNIIKIQPFENGTEAGLFTTYEVPKYIKTSHCLFIHYDSWIIDPGMWRDEFLTYDYIGAPWWHRDNLGNVGNSGFCLRSTALMQYLADHREEFPMKTPEDVTLCREYRHRLPQFTWAPENVAKDFAFERVRSSLCSRHFGFHGMFNWPFVLSYEQLNARVALALQNPYILNSGMLQELSGIWYSRWGNASDPAIYSGV